MTTPDLVGQFLRGRRIAVAGVSRNPANAANAILRKLEAAGYEVVAINPNATEVEGRTVHPDITSVPGEIDGLVFAAHPRVAVDVVNQCAKAGVGRIWFHRSFGTGSVSPEAVAVCRAHGIEPIVGGCPLMFCEPVDVGHRCMRWWLQWRGRVPR